MRYVVLGAGAVGGTLGGLLAEAGREVLLVARGAHAAALAADGLTLGRPDRTLRLHLPVADPARLDVGSDDVLLLTTKTTDTPGLLDLVAAQPGAGGLPVVCAQNGVENERLALRRFSRVYGVCVFLPATHLEPGRVDAEGMPFPGILRVGRYPTGSDDLAAAVAADLRTAGFRAEACADVMRWKHAKLLRNLGNALEVLCGSRGSRGSGDDGDGVVAELERQAREEAVACYAAAGIAVATAEEWRAMGVEEFRVGAVEGRSRVGGSTWQSVARGSTAIEVDYLNGEMVLLGRLHGVPTPVNELLQREANALARERRPPGSVPPADLLARLASRAGA